MLADYVMSIKINFKTKGYIRLHATTWINFVNIMLNAVSQTPKTHITPLIRGIDIFIEQANS